MKRIRTSFSDSSIPSAQPGISCLLPELDFEPSYLERFDPPALAQGELVVLGQRISLDDGACFADTSLPALISFNLHYMEYLNVPFASYAKTRDCLSYQMFLRIFRAWEPHALQKNAKHPYVLSLRLIHLANAAEVFGDALRQDGLEQALRASIYSQYRMLLQQVEWDVRANHLFENLKTLTILSLYFGEQAVYRRQKQRLLGQLREQILPSGLHYERSLMYHKIILESVMRVAVAVQEADPPFYATLLEYIQRMAGVLKDLEADMGKTPFFNDSADDVAKETSCLLLVAEKRFHVCLDGNMSEETEYLTARGADYRLVMDCGYMGPDHQPGHAHCDCLSFELSRNGQPVIVNSGTYAYTGELRGYFRSGKAHNTATLDGVETLECWADFRVARRMRHVWAKREDGLLTGGYTRYDGVKHVRRIAPEDAEIQVVDRFTKKGVLSSYLHFYRGITLHEEGAEIMVVQEGRTLCRIRPLDGADIRIFTAPFSQRFYQKEDTFVLEMTWTDADEGGYEVVLC